jgi:Bacterial cadherin-like domain/Bacterial pre-peptidase C-terminal domain
VRNWGDWGDYTGDGQLDLIITGDVGYGTPTTRLYNNSYLVNKRPVANNDSYTTTENTPLILVSDGTGGLLSNDTDADLVLLDSNFNVVATSSQLGTRKESIKRLLATGTYYVQVKLTPGVTARTAYDLAIGG